MNNFREKRAHPRLDRYAGAPVEGSLVAGNDYTQLNNARLVNHSDGGIQIIVKDLPTARVGDILLINIRLSEAPGEREVEGRIAWLLHENDTDRMGVEYCEPLIGMPYFF